MKEELESLLKDLGLSPAEIAGVVIIAGIIVFFVKRAINLRDKRKDERHKTLSEYAGRQEEALLKAYRKLYESGVNHAALSKSEFLQVISEADELIMKPFTRYRSELPADVQNRIYKIHNVLAQFKPDPAFPIEVTKESILRLAAYRESFLQEIQSVKDLLRRIK